MPFGDASADGQMPRKEMPETRSGRSLRQGNPRIDRSLRRLAVRNGSNGAQGRNRTTDTAIFSRMLYQLSYLGAPFRWRRAYRTR